MRGTPVTYKPSGSSEEFTVYPEYCGLSLEELSKNSMDGTYHIATLPLLGHNMMVIHYKGEKIYSRPKYRLFKTEHEVTPGEVPPITLNINNNLMLPLICYELMFPEDYLKLYQWVSVIIHMVGFPMYDENQKEGWVAMQKALTIIYNCPLVCCCGGPMNNFNISGIIYPQGEKNGKITRMPKNESR